MMGDRFVGQFSDLHIYPVSGSDYVKVEISTHNPRDGQPSGYVVDVPLRELRSLIDQADAEGRPNAELGRRMWAVRVASESLGVGHEGIRGLAQWLAGEDGQK